MVMAAMLTTGLRVAESQTLRLYAEDDGAHGVTRALAVARSQRSLAEARRDYTRSRFDRCAARLRGAELDLRLWLRQDEDLALMKRLNLWLGLCLAVAGESTTAGRAFVRAARLPGPGPDGQIFPPQVMKQYREATAPGDAETCNIQLDGGHSEVRIDGRTTKSGAAVTPGQHYAVWQRHGIRSALVQLDPPGCRLNPPVLSAVAGGPVVGPAEAQDRAFLARVGRIAGVQKVWLVQGVGDGMQAKLFDVGSAAFSGPSRRFDSLGGSTGPPKHRAAPQATPWYKKWWVWTLVGVGVGAAVVVPVVLSREERYDLVF
jgi:hypothetical protein